MTKLSVIHPHRDKPKDISYRSQKEFSFCFWCKHHSSDTIYPHNFCSSKYAIPKPDTTDRWDKERCDIINPCGDCAFFAPSLLTKVLRFFRLAREPIYRDPIKK